MRFVFNGELLVGELLVVKLFGTHDCLSCVVDQNVQFLHVGLNIVYQGFDLDLRNEITLNYLQTIFPVLEVLLGFVTSCGVVWKPRGNYHSCSVSQQTQSYLQTNFDPAPCHQRSPTSHVCPQLPSGKVQLSTGRTERTIKGVDISLFVADPANVAFQVIVGSLLWVAVHWAF